MNKIQNKEKYISLVNKCTETRRYLNEVLHVKMKKFHRLFDYAFNKDKREFLILKDLYYYQGGWPSDNTLAKAEVLIRNTALMINFLTLAKKEQVFQPYLEKYGISIVINKPDSSIDEASKSPLSLMRQWKELYGDKPIPEDKGEFLAFLLDEAWLLQSEICDEADSIKIDGAEEAEKHCKIMREGFINSVDINVAKTIQEEKLKKKPDANVTSVQNKIDKTKKVSNALQQSISIF